MNNTIDDDIRTLVDATADGNTSIVQALTQTLHDPARIDNYIEALAATKDDITVQRQTWAARLAPTMPLDEYRALRAEHTAWRARATRFEATITAALRAARTERKRLNIAEADNNWQARFYALNRAIQQHRTVCAAEYEPTPADTELWATAEALTKGPQP